MKQVFNCWNIVKYPAHGIEGVETVRGEDAKGYG